MSFSDKHIVVTGGGSGVGSATAKAFAEAGARVTIMGRTRANLVAQGLPFQICDVADSTSVGTAFDRARSQQGSIDVAVANAGVAESMLFSRMSSEHLDKMLRVNLGGVVNTWQSALDDMRTAGWGRLIAIASTAGLKGYAYVSAYCAAKHGVIGLTRGVALELAKTGITVNAICPGFIETPMLQRSIDNIADKTGKSFRDIANSLRSSNPQDRFIQVEEVAQSALWLASDEASSINGHALSLSGGEI
ncbi:MAG: SDR family oxidoreductase [Gammaproteobacteria bacterium]|nr:SDR family oxidoreductase [Gammaproteobacteria bacterium]